MTPREVALRVLLRVERDRAWASRTLSAELDRSTLSQQDRALTTELVYGMLRHRARIDRALEPLSSRSLAQAGRKVRAALRLGAYQILFLDRVPSFAAVSETVDWIKDRVDIKTSGYANAVLRRLIREGEPAPARATDDLAGHALHVHSMPPWITQRLQKLLPDEQVIAFAQVQNESSPTCLRTNTLRTTQEALAKTLADDVSGGRCPEPGALSPEALYLDHGGAPHHLAEYDQGLFAVQDEAAQMVSHLLAPEAGQRILDGCAGVGTKSTHIAALMKNTGRVDAIDSQASKVELCRQAAQRMGASIVHAKHGDLLGWPEADYDAILLDAPCSGLGVLRHHPESKWQSSEQQLSGAIAEQANLLDAAASRLRPGGSIVYAVCSFTLEETSSLIKDFLAEHDDLAIEPPHNIARKLIQIDGSVRTWTHIHNVDTFYAVRLRKRGVGGIGSRVALAG